MFFGLALYSIFWRIFLRGAFVNFNVQLQPTTVFAVISGFFLSGSLLAFLCVLISSRRLLQPSFVELCSSSRPPGYFPLAAFLPACICFVLPALLCCNVVFRVNLLRISLTYFQLASEYSTSSISCHHKVVRALWLLLLKLISFYVRARTKVR